MLNTKALGAAYSGPTVLPPGYASYYPDSLPQGFLSNVMDWSSGYLTGVCFGNNEWVVVGQSGYIATAVPNLTSGTRKTSGTTQHLNGIVWAGTLGRYIAVGNNGTILLSADATTWTAQTSGTTIKLNAVHWDGAQFLAVGDGVILTSPNGTAWTLRTNYLNINTNLSAVAKSPSRYVAVGAGGTIRHSVDGITWLGANQPSGTSAQTMTGVAWNGSYFVIVATSMTSVFVSTDGITWSLVNDATAVSGNTFCIWAGSRFIAGSGTGPGRTSVNATDWVQAPLRYTTAAASNGSTVLVVGGVNTSFRGTTTFSTDGGSTWFDIATYPKNINAIVWSGTQFVAVGAGGYIATSTDGVTWVQQNSGTSESILTVIWTGSKFVATANSSRVLYSDDGVVWGNAVISGTTYTFYGLTYGAGLYIVCGTQGKLFTSTNLTTWTERATGTTSIWRAITYTGTYFIMVGNGGMISVSATGTSGWTDRRTSNTTQQLNTIAHSVSPSRIITMGNAGTVRFSNDGGITWSSLANVSTKNINRLIGSTSGKFFGVGQDGLICASDGGLIWSWWMQAVPIGLSAVRQLGAVAGNASKIVASGDYADLYVS